MTETEKGWEKEFDSRWVDTIHADDDEVHLWKEDKFGVLKVRVEDIKLFIAKVEREAVRRTTEEMLKIAHEELIRIGPMENDGMNIFQRQNDYARSVSDLVAKESDE